ncbi:hypothetical protein COO59_00690 [Mixta theicola]|uniref:Uncharacterized protein n=2 Tax=Mixta theicola TaxID=1458355 RepID=A0A2K1QEC4_9GAMM|nr:hypothetical protein [Mixta theicola]PNS13368.1 hypothetical protein COO59_00690 [Mixta theicola]GLR09677.1 hypothetical protein GCM10007905_23970 [Mixta theicola]
MKALTITELIVPTGAGANTGDPNVGHTKNHSKNGGGSNSSNGNNCPPYMNPIFKDCMNGILGGMIGASVSGPGAALGGAVELSAVASAHA